MPRFAANLTFLWTDRPFVSRFDAAARAGFAAVEYMFPYAEDLDAVAAELRRLKLRQTLFNLPAGNWAAGDRGIAVAPGRREEFRDGVRKGIEVAQFLHCPRVNCLVGKQLEDVPLKEQWDCLVDNIKMAATAFEEVGLVLLVEPINTIDMPGFFLRMPSEACWRMSSETRRRSAHPGCARRKSTPPSGSPCCDRCWGSSVSAFPNTQRSTGSCHWVSSCAPRRPTGWRGPVLASRCGPWR